MGATTPVESHPTSQNEHTPKPPALRTPTAPLCSAIPVNRKRSIPYAGERDDALTDDESPTAKRTRHDPSYRDRAAALANVFPDNHELYGLLKHIAATELPDQKKVSEVSALLDKLGDLELSPSTGELLNESAQKRTETLKKLTRRNKERTEKEESYRHWLVKSNNVLSQTWEAQEEGRKLREERRRLRDVVYDLDSDLREEEETMRRLEAGKDASLKVLSKDMKELTDELEAWMCKAEKELGEEFWWVMPENETVPERKRRKARRRHRRDLEKEEEDDATIAGEMH